MSGAGGGGYGTVNTDVGGGKRNNEKEGGDDPGWVVTLRDMTGAAPASSERLDVAKFIFILLVCSGHFMEPFYKIGHKPTTVYMHVIYGFHVPAFVLISGYVSGDLNPKRRRALIGGIIAPFLVLHVMYSVWYTRAFCEREDGRPQCQFVKDWSLLDPQLGRWDGWDKWTFAYPFAQLWYLVSLLTKRIWRPFALEMRWTLLFHVVLGVLVGYTTVGRFLSLHRSTVHMPYFLCGYLMKKHKCFFPAAKSAAAKAAALVALALIVAAAFIATYEKQLKVEVWFQSDPHDQIYGDRWAYGALYQLALYAWTFFTMCVAFALVPEPETIGVKYPGEDDAGVDEDQKPLMGGGGGGGGGSGGGGGKMLDEEGGGGGGGGDGGAGSAARRAAAARRRVGRYGKEWDQDELAARVYLRLAKWGSRTLYPFVWHIAALLLVAQFTDWYEVTWQVESGSEGPAVTTRAAWTMALAFTVVVVLSLRPVTYLFKWLLEPDISILYSPELQKV